MKYYFLIIAVIISFYSVPGQDKSNLLGKTATNDHYNFINVNRIKMWASNTGFGSHDPITGAGGFFWSDCNNTKTYAVYWDGLLIGAKVNDEILISGSTYRTALQPGKILSNGQPDNASLDKYRLFKITKSWDKQTSLNDRQTLKKDYDEWPAEDGALYEDINNDGKFTRGIDVPLFEGDEVLWSVANDFDTARTTYLYGTTSMGLEIQTTIFGFDYASGVLANSVFKKYLIINKGGNYLKDAYIGLWSDPDIGFANDDFVGCDTRLNMAYAYNGDNFDENYYNDFPPALGYVLLNCPIVSAGSTDTARIGYSEITGYKNLRATSFIIWIASTGVIDPIEYPSYSTLYYNALKGLIYNGDPIIDPNTNESTKFPLSGDPVTKTGWYEGAGWPGGPPADDRRMMLSSGPFNMAPGDTQEVVFAITIARGTDNISSITELRKNAMRLHNFYKYYVPDKSGMVWKEPVPDYYELAQNYPNPFNPSTVIKYSLPVEQYVDLKVYNLLGEEVAGLVAKRQPAGEYSVVFDGSDLSAGIYFYFLNAGPYTRVKKMMILK